MTELMSELENSIFFLGIFLYGELIVLKEKIFLLF